MDLEKLRELLKAPRRVVDVFGALFKRPIDPGDTVLMNLATGESVAYLNFPMARGEAVRRVKRGIATNVAG